MSDLPAGWVETTIGEVVETKVEQRTPLATEHFYYIDISSIDRTAKKIVEPQKISGKDAPSRARQVVASGDVLVSMTRPNLNAVAMVSNDLDGQIASTGFDVLRAEDVESRWLYYLVRTNDFVTAMSDLVQGALYPAVRPRDIRNFEIPLAPLNEQKRIAEKLDSLLARVDSCQSHLERVPQILKRFRQSVLAAAFRGELTEQNSNTEPTSVLLNRIQTENQRKWEERQGNKKYISPEPVNTSDLPELPNGWVWATPEQLASAEQYALAIGPFGSNLMVKDYTDDGVPLIFVRNIRSGVFTGGKTSYVSHQKADELKAHKVVSGDIVITKMGEPPGDAFLYPDNMPDAIATSDCVKWSLSPLLSEKMFFVHAIHSPMVKDQISQITKGVAQQKMSLARFKTIAIPVPPLEEQAEIVRRVEKLFAYAERLEARYQSASERVGRLTPSLLAKGFRGELLKDEG